jgi:hypothetical protein
LNVPPCSQKKTDQERHLKAGLNLFEKVDHLTPSSGGCLMHDALHQSQPTPIQPKSPSPAQPPQAAAGNRPCLRDVFIKHLRIEGTADRTIAAYCNAMKMFVEFTGKPPLQATVNDIRAFFSPSH